MNLPLILLIFANDPAAYLDSIRKERQRLISLLQPAADVPQGRQQRLAGHAGTG